MVSRLLIKFPHFFQLNDKNLFYEVFRLRVLGPLILFSPWYFDPVFALGGGKITPLLSFPLLYL